MASLDGVEDIGSAVVNAVKRSITTTFDETGEFVSSGVTGVASIVQGAIQGVWASTSAR